MKTQAHLWTYFVQFSLEWEMFQTEVVEEIKTHFVVKDFFFSQKSYHLCDNMEKYGRSRQATDDNMYSTPHAHFI